MALTMKTFGRLVSAVSSLTNHALGTDEIQWFHDIAADIAVIPETAAMLRSHVDLDPLFKALLNPNDKIEAIKQYRVVTGEGLKESKDAVESIMNFIQSERYVSEGYVRLRNMIPGALLTPTAPSREQIREVTEVALTELLNKARSK